MRARVSTHRYQQVDDIYTTLTTSNNSDYPTRPMTLGCAGYNNKQVTFWAYGIPYGLLQYAESSPYHTHCLSVASLRSAGASSSSVVCCCTRVLSLRFRVRCSLDVRWHRHDMVERFLLHYFAMSAHTCEFLETCLVVSCASSSVFSERMGAPAQTLAAVGLPQKQCTRIVMLVALTTWLLESSQPQHISSGCYSTRSQTTPPYG